jgi:hypothetical protein
MNIAESLMKVVEKRDYNSTVGCIQNACEEVFGYRKMGECNEDMEKDRQPFITSEEIAPGLLSLTITNIPELVPKKGEKVFGKCFHYGNSSTKNPEGVVSHVIYSRNQGNFKLAGELLSVPSVRISGYGDRWWNGRDSYQTPSCFEEKLKVPHDVLSLSEVSFEGFIKEIRGKQVTV